MKGRDWIVVWILVFAFFALAPWFLKFVNMYIKWVMSA